MSEFKRLATIPDAVDALRAGRPVLVMDDANRENEGDVVFAANLADPRWVAWTIRHTSGVLCAPLTAGRADELALPPMVEVNQDPRRTAYTVSVDARVGVGTGISADDRARTLRLLSEPGTAADDLVRPGHVFPLRARPGGVLARQGHTEAAVDLCRLAGLPPVGAIAEVVNDDGGMARLADILALGDRFDLPVVSIAELVAHRRTEHSPLWTDNDPSPPRVRRASDAMMTTTHGPFRAIGYRDLVTGAEHLALAVGEPGPDALVRVHSECLTGEAFGSLRCECGPQLETALARVARESGIVVYLRGHEGRGIGLVKKIAAYGLQNRGRDTVEANLELGEPADGREYGGAAAILADLGVPSVRLLTNNPRKVADLEAGGIRVTARIPLIVGVGPHNNGYLRVKRDVMGHALPS
jgi:3,4-dihydroxy 2-butanone 4-phosphate synthase/GTP cyclohydrolase II